MAEKITVVELDINEQAFLKAAEATKIAIDKIVLSQKKLEAQGKKNSQEFIKNEATLKKLGTEFLNQKKAIIALESPYAKLSRQLIIARTKAKDLAVEFGVNSKQARKAAEGVRDLDAKLKSIDKSVGQSQRNVGNYSKSIGNITARFLGWSAVIFGVIRGLKSMFKNIVAFDKQLIAVGKTTNLSKEELQAFGTQVIDLGIKLKGISTQSLLETAEVAGQLGIRGSENILRFAETIEKLGLTSDIIGQDAARSFAKFIEVSSDSVQNADRLGSVITELGNNFATTEGEILKNTTEIQKGIAIYATSAQGVLALGAATSALGSQAEASRGALQTVFKVLNEGATSGKNLEKILKLTGQTQSEFVAEFGTNSIETFRKFIKGLSDSSDSGENLSSTLTSLNLDQKRVEAVVGALAKNYDTLEDSLSRANTEYEKNEALNIEAEAASKSLDSIIGDMDDSWKNLTLSIEKGDGALAGFTKSAVISVTDLFNSLNDISTVSEEGGNFVSNFFKAFFSPDAEKAIQVQAQQIRLNKERVILANELANILNKQQEKLGGSINVQETSNKLQKENIDFLKEQIRFQGEKAQKEAAAETERLRLIEQAKEREKQLTEKEKKERDKKIKEQQEQEKKDLVTFEQDKIDLLNEIEVAKAESQTEKDTIKAEQKLKKDLLELEQLSITEFQKNELEALIRTEHLLRLDEIDEEHRLKTEEIKKVNQAKKDKLDEQQRKKEIRLQKQFNKEDVALDKVVADAKKGVSSALQGALSKILGDGLASRLLNIILGAKAEIAAVNITTAAAQARNLAQATAVAPPPLNAIPIAIATTQNIGLGAKSKVATARIITAAAISAASSAFYEGGQVPQGTGGVISGSNIPTQRGGDNILATVKSGEVILNEDQQARAGGSAFFNSIGVPGFQTGGKVGIPSSISTPITQANNNDVLIERFAEIVNDVKIVAIESDITDAQVQQVEIVSGANI